jgi:MoxR-like ATPase
MGSQMTENMQAAVSGVHPHARRLGSVSEITGLLSSVGYLATEHTSTVLQLADQLGKPILIEGPTGSGKTDLGISLAAATGTRLIRMQCYEGLDEAKALYEWNYSKQLLRIMAGRVSGWSGTGEGQDVDIFTDEYLLTRPLLDAIRATEPVILLIDEVDRLDVEAEALLLEVLSDFQVSIPGLGTVTGAQVPMVFLTSNSTRDLSEALKRRCLYLHIDYPTTPRERDILRARVPGISEHLAGQLAAFVASLRQLDLQQVPSVSQTLEWARTLLALGAQDLDAGLASDSLDTVLSNRSDVERAAAQLAAGRLGSW